MRPVGPYSMMEYSHCTAAFLAATVRWADWEGQEALVDTLEAITGRPVKVAMVALAARPKAVPSSIMELCRLMVVLSPIPLRPAEAAETEHAEEVFIELLGVLRRAAPGAGPGWPKAAPSSRWVPL